MKRNDLKLDAEKKHTSTGGIIKDEMQLSKNREDVPAHVQSNAPQSSRRTARQSINSYRNPEVQSGNEVQESKHNQPDSTDKSGLSDNAATNAAKTPGQALRGADSKPAVPAFKAVRDKKLLHNSGNKPPIELSRRQNKADGLKTAKSKLPAKYKLQRESMLRENRAITQKRLKTKKLSFKPAKTAANAAVIYSHGKIYQVENENSGIKAAHSAQIAAETATRSALHFKKTAPYRHAEKLEKKAAKKSVNRAYQKSLAENPKRKSNILSRMMQKRRIKREYAKAAREAKKRAKKSASTTKKIAETIAKHPVMTVILIIVILLMLVAVPFFGTCTGLAGNTTSAIVQTTFLAADDDMYAAEAMYAQLENELQYELDNFETLHPDYDEYIYELDDIEHDPYVLISILHAFHDGEWTIDDVQETLAMLFEKQYILTETVTIEMRTRTVTNTYINTATGVAYQAEEEEEYEYYICTVTLENFDLSHVPVYIMSEPELSRYAMLMWTLGNRPDLFPTWLYPHASTLLEYEMYDIPQTDLDADPRFAAMIAEANKYLGMPYVWGGSSPSTSFDCSGFVSWVLNHSGWNIGRLGARGLHSICTNVPPSQARPGNLVFFHHTYKAQFPEQATHVGIYVGNGMMVHCGNPIGYTSIETKYWQEHFLAFGQLP